MLKESKGDDVDYKSHTTQVNLYDCASEKDFNFFLLQKRIPEDCIYRELPQVTKDTFFGSGYLTDDPKEQYGLESIAHISCLYGIKDEKDYFGIRDKLKDFGSFPFEIGNVSSFRTEGTPYDVLVLEIKSPKLHEVHKIIKDNFKNDYKFPEYKPHMTLAYVKKGTCKELEGKCDWTGTTYNCGIIKFNHTDKYSLDIPLM